MGQIPYFAVHCPKCKMYLSANWTYNEAFAIRKDHNNDFHDGHVVAQLVRQAEQTYD